MNETQLVVVPLDTPADRSACAAIALLAYSGERCRFCHKEVVGAEALRDVVYAGYSEHGRIAHQACWDAQPSDVIDSIRAACEAERRP